MAQWFKKKNPSANAGDGFDPSGQDFDPWVGKILWRRNWQCTPVCVPGNSSGQRNLEGSSLWSQKGVGHNLATKQQ